MPKKSFSPILPVLSMCSLASLVVLSYQLLVLKDEYYIFMALNLFLSWIPLVLAILIPKQSSNLALIILFTLWLLFLPNTAYVITDFMHLGEISRDMLWIDVLVVTSFSLTSLTLGSYSTVLLFNQFKKRFNKLLAWNLVITTSLLCGVGIYMSRFLRLNSWDAIIHPLNTIQLTVERYLHPFHTPSPIHLLYVWPASSSAAFWW